MNCGPLAMLLLAAALLHLQPAYGDDSKSLHVLLQGSSAPELAGLVEAHGGSVTHDLHIIDAVGARLTRAQLTQVLASDLVYRHMDDLGEEELREEEEPECRVRGHIEITIADNRLTWPLYNKKPGPAAWRTLELSWPQELGRVASVALGEHTLDAALLDKQDEGRLSVDFSARKAPVITSRQDLVVTFAAQDAADRLAQLPQSAFDIDAGFGEDCTTDLVPGYPDNAGDYYYNTVAGVDALHRQGIRGQGVTVAVIDSGLWEHPALMRDTAGRERVLARYDAITDTSGREVLDDSGHGTHMTSIIAHSGPTTRNGIPTGTYKGVAPDARLVAVKILDREGFAHLLDIVRSVQWVVDNRERYDIRVLNLSFAQLPRWHYWEDPVNQAVMRAWAAGIAVVVAAGNEGPDPGTIGSPGNLPYVITVGAVTDSWTPETRDDDYIPDFSSRGPTPAGHVKPDVVALGGHMTGLVHPDSDLAVQQPEDILASGEYVSTGSSQAAALVSGIVALLLQLEPGLTPDDIKCKLITSAEPAINRDGRLAYSPFEQGYGYVTVTRAITLGETGCGNRDLDIAADIADEGQFFGPALEGEDGRPTLTDLEQMVAAEPSAQGMSDTRKWGVKEHIERLDPPRPEAANGTPPPFDWQQIYLREKAAIERLAEGARGAAEAAR